jgi:hypothetical protein
MSRMKELRALIDAAFEERSLDTHIEALVAMHPVEMLQVRALLEIAKNLE